jgi:hypothetical protein
MAKELFTLSTIPNKWDHMLDKNNGNITITLQQWIPTKWNGVLPGDRFDNNKQFKSSRRFFINQIANFVKWFEDPANIDIRGETFIFHCQNRSGLVYLRYLVDDIVLAFPRLKGKINVQKNIFEEKKQENRIYSSLLHDDGKDTRKNIYHKEKKKEEEEKFMWKNMKGLYQTHPQVGATPTLRSYKGIFTPPCDHDRRILLDNIDHLIQTT